jgi:phosphoribosylanthranilate isomerase
LPQRVNLFVKICGITSVSDARAASDAGADALGFMFYPGSPRHLELQTAESIARDLPAGVIKVGVFVNPDERTVLDAIAACGLNVLQFHGEEECDFCRQFGLMTIKAFRVRDGTSLDQLDGCRTDAWLLDSAEPGRHGGTGKKFDWDLAARAVQRGRPIFLAGGLTPENVAAAVSQVRPFAVDVSTGVESSPGQKDARKGAAFIRNARQAAAAIHTTTKMSDAFRLRNTSGPAPELSNPTTSG